MRYFLFRNEKNLIRYGKKDKVKFNQGILK